MTSCCFSLFGLPIQGLVHFPGPPHVCRAMFYGLHVISSSHQQHVFSHQLSCCLLARPATSQSESHIAVLPACCSTQCAPWLLWMEGAVGRRGPCCALLLKLVYPAHGMAASCCNLPAQFLMLGRQPAKGQRCQQTITGRAG